MSTYSDRLHEQIQRRKTPALVGLDPRADQLPAPLRTSAVIAGQPVETAAAFEEFSLGIIDAVVDLVPAVKPQVAFFEQLGPPGMAALQRVIRYARDLGLIVIADAKRGDIGSTAAAYADAWLAGSDASAAPFAADALTVNAYLGVDTLRPFVDRAKDRGAGIYVLVRTSNPGAVVFQDRTTNATTLYEAVADEVEALSTGLADGSDYGSIGAVVGATWPTELADLRRRMPHVPLLVPGYGSQGGTAADVSAAFDDQGLGALINSSRAINFAFQSPKYRDRYSEDNWRDATIAATREMIVDLAEQTPASILQS